MKELEKVFPQDTLYLVYALAISIMFFFFGLTWTQAFYGILIDTVAFFLFYHPGNFLFYLIFPKFKKLRTYLNNGIDSLSEKSEQQELFELLSDYPEKRSICINLLSPLKVLAVGVYIAVVSPYDLSFLQKLGLFYLADFILIIYASGLLFVQLHTITSSMMSDLKLKPTWIENYRDLKLPYLRDRFLIFQNATLGALLLNLCLVVVYVIQMPKPESWTYFYVMFVSTILCIGAMHFKFQGLIKSSLEGMFKLFNDKLLGAQGEIMPLHTIPLVAGFEHSFNQLGAKLKERENEISQWIKFESEQFHLRTLGEMTALVAHDIKTPLSVMKMCMEVINDRETTLDDVAKYKFILEKNLDQSISFTQTLMAYLKGNNSEDGCMIKEIHFHLLELFRTQFHDQNFSDIEFSISEEMTNMKLSINRLDAMHVFYNLYLNAIKAVLTHSDSLKKVSLTMEPQKQIMYLTDSGPGLNKESFDQMMNYQRFSSSEAFSESLGLRLTNTLLKQLGGSLDVVPVQSGTCFRIAIPIA